MPIFVRYQASARMHQIGCSSDLFNRWAPDGASSLGRAAFPKSLNCSHALQAGRVLRETRRFQWIPRLDLVGGKPARQSRRAAGLATDAQAPGPLAVKPCSSLFALSGSMGNLLAHFGNILEHLICGGSVFPAMPSWGPLSRISTRCC